MGEIKFALSSASILYRIDNKKKVEIARDEGFDGVEMLLTRRSLNQIKDNGKTDGILSLHQPFREGGGDLFDKVSFFDLKPFPKPWNYEEYFQIASKFDTPVVTHINDIHFRERTVANREEVILEFNTYQKDFKPISPQDLLKKAKELDCSICFDVGYAKQAGWDLANSFQILQERVDIIHLYDLRKKDPKWTFDKNLTCGKGILDLNKFLKEVKRLDWSGQITFELLPKPFANHKKSLVFAKKILS